MYFLAAEPGIGKTLLASIFAQQMCKQGEKVLYVSFEESPDALIHNIMNAGINLDTYRKSGNLYILSTCLKQEVLKNTYCICWII